MTEILIGDFLVLLFVFLRISAMIFTVPVLGNQAVPAIAKIFLSFVIAYIVFLTIDKGKITIDVNLITIFVLGIKEILIGLIMGYSLNFIFYGISYASHIIGYDMGLMFAEVLNPMQELSNNVVGEVLFYASIMIFIIINGHHHLITAVVSSFGVIPIGKYVLNKPLVDLIIYMAGSVFTIALKIAAPILVSYFLIHIAEGIIARVLPQVQVFFISQPLKLGLGFALLAALVPLYVMTIKYLLNNYENQLTEILKTMSV
ncbi:MAG: flagellar biosynthetic protein FliR [Melioribacteraceae bacterium]|nr:flagellar biosynthetic protein FliR [Melioribacteraceae bacterium]